MRYLIFFTIIANILVAIIATRAAIRPDDRSGMNSPRLEMVVALAIIIVGVVYGIFMAHLVSLSGFRLFVDRCFTGCSCCSSRSCGGPAGPGG